MAGPLAPFGYTLNRLKPGKDGKGMVCCERTPVGAPLLAVPLAACWTPQVAEKECAVLGEVMAAACERNPASELLKADETWIALHLLQERSRGEGATPIRKSHVALLPKVPESLLAWDDLDIEGLKGSWWYDEALRRKEQVQLDFDALKLELGPAGAEALGLDKADYFWARQIVEQFGMQILQEDGSVRTLLVPGVELLQPGPSAPTGTAGARLEQGSAGSSPPLVFYAEKDYYPGDQVCLSHGGLACSNGCRLAGCGWLLESNAWDSVQWTLPLRLDKVPGERDQFGDLIEGLTDGCLAGIADGKPEAQPGECLPLGPLPGRLPVELTDNDDHVLFEVVLRFTKDRLLPTQSTLVHIGAALIADRSKQEGFMAMEKEVEGVFNNECCERRSLIFLQSELQALLGKYPASSKESTVHLVRSDVEGALPPRSARSVRLINGERQLLADVITAVQERLGLLIVASMSPAAAPVPPAQAPPKLPKAMRLCVPGSRTDLMLPLDALVSGVAPGSETALGKVLVQLGGVTRALEQLAARFLSASASGKFDVQEGAALKKELGVLRSCLESCPLGDPTAVSPVPLVSSKDDLVRSHSEATMAFLSAQLASLEWERARLESATKGSKPGSPEPLVSVLVELAEVRMRLLDFEGAHADFKRALELKPGIPQALECALSVASQKAEVLAGPASKWSGAGQILKSLRERLTDLGYMRAGARWSWPSRMPPVKNLASDPSLWSGKDSDVAASTERIKPGTYITKPSREDSIPNKHLDPSIMPYVLPRDQHSQELVGLIRLFMLHKAMPLSSAKDLLGAEVCSLLLKSSALTGIRTASGQLLSPDEAAALVPKASKGSADEPDVFSNVLLWPAGEDLLVALDFEQSVHLDSEYEPVPYLGQDSRALLLAVPRTPAASVLDVCCGAGAQGLAALRGYAQKATFLDSNPRALRFACFNAYLNGLGDRCTFVEGSLTSPELPKELKTAKFDVILSSPGSLPNPRMAVANGGPSFSRGGDEGEDLLSALVAKAAQQLLAPAGRLVAAAMVPNAGGLAKRLVGWADASASEPADLRAVVFRGKAVRDEEYVYLSTQSCPPASTAAYLGALRHADLRSVSQVLVLLRLPAAGAKVPRHAPRAETLPEHEGLWLDEAYLRAEVQGALDGLAATAALDEGTSAAEPLYALDWGEGEKGDRKSTVPIMRPGIRGGWSVLQGKSSSKNEYCITLDKTTGTNLGAQVNPGDGATLLIEAVLGGLFKDWNVANPRLQVNKGDRIIEVNGILGNSAQLLEECKQCKILQVRLRREAAERGPPEPTPPQKGEFVADACRWKDVAMHRLLGWSPPALCDWRWFKTALPLSAKQRGTPPTGFVMAMVELKGCRCPSEVKDALRSVNCTQRYTFEGEPRTLKPMDKTLQVQDMAKVLDGFDCLVLPLETGGGRSRPLHELPVEMVYFLEAVSRYVYATRRAIRLVMLTCGCSGPSYVGMTDDGYGMPAATPLRGIFRCSRIENLQVPILQIDSDALVEPGRGKELVAQIDVELELSAPDVGFYKADVSEQNRAIIHTHREVAYRSGARLLPKLDLCARNPIFPGAKIPTLMGSAAEGVALITGGTGGLGILTAEALVESGVKIIVLSSRSGRISRGYQGLDARLEALRMSGARIELEACDAKDAKQVEMLLEKIRKNLGPLKWIMNAAGIVLPQDPNLMEPVFEPKCLGAWNMHKYSLTDDIKTFMMYSSMSAGAGANDLANYAAANTYIDELARLRQSQGLSAVSIMFPEVEEAGMAADTIMAKGNPANIPPGNVKTTIKQVVCGKGPMAPCVAILPQGYLIPRSPTMDSMLDPLKARVDKDLWERLVRSEASGRR